MTEIDPKIAAIEQFFASAKLPKQIELYPGIKVINTAGFIESHLSILKANGYKGIYDVFYCRLERLKELQPDK